MTISANYPSIRPSLLLDFANTKQLDPRITYSRASTGTYYDGKTTVKAEENLLTYSQDFDNAAWVKSNATVAANSTAAPDGTTTADLMYPTTAGILRGVYQTGQASILTTATAKVFSIYAKAAGISYILLVDASNANQRTWFDVSTGTVGTTAVNHTASIVSVGNGWYRCIVSTSIAWGANPAIGWCVADADNSITSTPSGANGVYLWGAQLEQRSSATAYTPTTTAPITNYIPALQTAAAGVPRFDHDPITGESKGFLIEEQRTNLLTYSQDFTNAAWLYSNTASTANVTIAPDGTLTASKLYSNSGVSGYLYRTTTNANSTTSFYLKYAGSQYCLIGNAASRVVVDLLNGTLSKTSDAYNTYTISNVSNGWYRVSNANITATTYQLQLYPNVTSAGVVINGDGYSGIYIWGAQLEAGSFPTSYIPTVASQVTRSADSASMTGSNFSSWYRTDEGTLYAEAQAASLSYNIFNVSDGTANNVFRIQNYTSSQFQTYSTGTLQANLDGGNPVAGTFEKYGAAYKTNDFALSFNGGTVATDTVAVVPTVTQMNIGRGETGLYPINGCIKRIAYYPKRLSNTELQAITS